MIHFRLGILHKLYLSKKYLIILGFISLSILMWVSYIYLWKKSTTVWDYISEEAYFVYEFPSNLSNLSDLTKTAFWEKNTHLPFIRHFIKLSKHFDIEIDKIDDSLQHTFDNIIPQNSFFLAGFPINTSKTSWTSYVKIGNEQEEKKITKMLRLLYTKPQVKREERVYNGIDIFTFTSHLYPELNLSFLYHDDFLVFSPHRELIEETARLMRPISYSLIKSFNEILKDEQIQWTFSDTKYGKIMFQTRKIKKIALLFGLEKDQLFLNKGLLSKFGHAQFHFTDTKFSLNGYLYSGGKHQGKDNISASQKQYLSIFEKQASMKFSFENWVPNHAEQVIHWALSDPKYWHKKQSEYFTWLNDTRQISNLAFENKYDFSFHSFIQQLTGELSLIYVASYDEKTQDKILVCGIKHKQKMLNYLNAIQEKKTGKKLNKDYSSPWVIYQLEISDFPQKVLGPVFNHFSHCYFSLFDNHLIISNNDEQLKKYIRCVERKEVWAKRQNFELLKEIKETSAQLKYIVNTKDYYNSFARKSEQFGNGVMKHYEERLINLEYIFAEINQLSPHLTSLDLSLYFKNNDQEDNHSQHKSSKEIINYHSISVDSLIITPPYVLNTKKKNVHQVLFQDQSKVLHYFISSQKEFVRGLYGQIQNEVYSIPRGKEGIKTAFITTDSLFLVDEQGKNWDTFPIQPSDKTVLTHLSVFHTKNDEIQLLISTIDGKIYKYNEWGVPAKGWNPKTVDSRLSSNISYLKKNKNDFYIFSTYSGKLYVTQADGTVQMNFPLNLGDHVTSPHFIKQGININKTSICLVTENGIIYKTNLLGRKLEKMQIVNHAVDAKFYLVKEAHNKNYIVVEKSDTRVYFYNHNGKLLFNKELYLSTAYSFQFYHLEKDEVYYIINDEFQNITYIYDYKFSLLGNSPINSIGKVVLKFEQNNIYIYRNFNNHSDVLHIKKP